MQGNHRLREDIMKNHKTAVQVQATQNLRRSGAAGSHGDRRTKRLRTRAAQKRAHIKEYA
jgi:hypothetical protein